MKKVVSSLDDALEKDLEAFLTLPQQRDQTSTHVEKQAAIFKAGADAVTNQLGDSIGSVITSLESSNRISTPQRASGDSSGPMSSRKTASVFHPPSDGRSPSAISS